MAEEKERTGSATGGGSGEELEHDVVVMGTPLKVKMPAGGTLADLLQKIKEEHGVRFNEYLCRLNDRDIDLTEENPVLTEASTISLVQKIAGGK